MRSITIRSEQRAGEVVAALTALWPTLVFQLFRDDDEYNRGDPYASALTPDDVLCTSAKPAVLVTGQTRAPELSRALQSFDVALWVMRRDADGRGGALHEGPLDDAAPTLDVTMVRDAPIDAVEWAQFVASRSGVAVCGDVAVFSEPSTGETFVTVLGPRGDRREVALHVPMASAHAAPAGAQATRALVERLGLRVAGEAVTTAPHTPGDASSPSARRAAVVAPDETQPVDFTARSVAWLVDVCGVAANPSNPFGRSRLALHRTRAVLDNQSRTSTRRRFTCRVSPELLGAVVEHLRRAGFPAVPREALSPGSLRSLYLKRAEGELSTGLSLHTRAPGYADAFAALDALAFHLSGGALASTPRVSLADLGPAREVDLVARVRPDRPPFDDEADAVLEHAREIARDCQHEEVLPAHVLAYAGQSAYRYVLDRAGCDAAAVGAAAEGLLPEDGGTDADTDPGPSEELCDVEAQAAALAAAERAPEATLRHLVLALLRAPSLSEALRPFAATPAAPPGPTPTSRASGPPRWHDGFAIDPARFRSDD